MNYLKSFVFSANVKAGYTLKPHSFDFEKRNEDWKRFEAETGIQRDRVILPIQHHTERVVFDETPSFPCDGVFVSQKNVAVGVLTADCIPILVQVGDIAVGAIHAGWRGLVKGIVSKGLKRVCEHYGVFPADLRVSVGPGAGVCCYRVKEDVAKRFAEKDFPVFVENGVIKLDLHRVVMLELKTVGVENIELIRLCSICSGILHSHRRGDKGKNFSFIVNT